MVLTWLVMPPGSPSTAAWAVDAPITDDAKAPAQAASAVPRPTIKTDRWQEDWSTLADPSLRTQPFDHLKYVPLSPSDPKSYLSLGITARERFESNGAPAFGIGGNRRDEHLLDRLQFHVDVRPDENWQVFAQFEDVRAPGKRTISPADANPLDLRLAFLGYVNDLGPGTLKFRLGRQDFAFGLQRFVSTRDGPNVQQAFDAVWADWETPQWRVLGFVSQPVQYRFDAPFDDVSNRDLLFSTARVERKVLGDDELSAYWGRLQRSDASYLDASGAERRDVFDVRFAGSAGGLDWDLEGMGQTGRVGDKSIRSWALGTRAGYTFAGAAWTPRVGLQADTATGDRRPRDGVVGTFNPLFPNGYYFTLAGYTGYANLVHLKPSLTVKPIADLSLTAALALQWRQTTADAIYVQPNVALPGTAGRGDRWTGVYGQLRADYAFDTNLTGAVEAVRYDVGRTIRQAGGHDSEFLGVELKYSW